LHVSILDRRGADLSRANPTFGTNQALRHLHEVGAELREGGAPCERYAWITGWTEWAMDLELGGKVAVVTGGSAGIGVAGH
jgi:hypothetical protein